MLCDGKVKRQRFGKLYILHGHNFFVLIIRNGGVVEYRPMFWLYVRLFLFFGECMKVDETKRMALSLFVS